MEELAQQVIDIALGMDMWIFGGYVRDVIVRNQTKFGDIDIGCSEHQTNVDQFIRILGLRFKVSEVRLRRIARYSRMSRGIKRVEQFVINDMLHIDVVIFDGSFTEWREEESVDFTSNLFFKSRDVSLGIRYIPERFRFTANPMDELVKMTRDGVFERIWDVTYYSNHMNVLQMCNRARDLVRRGFTFKGSLITPLMELKLVDHTAIEGICKNIEASIHSSQVRRATRETIKCLNRSGVHFPREIYEIIES